MNIRTDIGHLLRLLYSCTYWHFYVEVDTAHLPGAAYFELGFQNIFSGTTCYFPQSQRCITRLEPSSICLTIHISLRRMRATRFAVTALRDATLCPSLAAPSTI